MPPVRIEITAVTVDEPYYRYHKSTGVPDFTLALPFGEPAFVYSNMSNKMGVIATYSVSDVMGIPLQ